MLFTELISQMITSWSQAYMISQLAARDKAIEKSGEADRSWSFMSIMLLSNWAYAPLATLLPTVSWILPYWGFVALSGGIFYLAFVAQHNQIVRNQNKLDQIKTLPWDLHTNRYLMKAALLLSYYLRPALVLLYLSSLVACCFFASPLLAAVSLGMYGVDQGYQQGYIPEKLRTPYMYLNGIIMLFSFFGVTSAVGLLFSTAMVVFSVVDYRMRAVTHKTSLTPQFPMTQSSKKLTIPVIEANEVRMSTWLRSLIDRHRCYRHALGLHVTFDHFYESQRIVKQVLADVPIGDYEQYNVLFESIDFTDSTVLENINNELHLDDKFNGQALLDRCGALKLPPTSSRATIEVAYLKKEMRDLVTCLQRETHEGLSPQQSLSLHTYARLVLANLPKKSKSEQAGILLFLVLSTGSHCNEIYLESFSSIAKEMGFLQSVTLTFVEQALLRVQSAREMAFRQYYYKVSAWLKENNVYFRYTWQNLNAYHTYEDFVQMFASNFCLLNTSLNTEVRSAVDVVKEQLFVRVLQEHTFSEQYTVAYLVKQAIEPGKLLFNTFVEWCLARQIRVLGEVNPMVCLEPEELTALAELMLLDLNVIALETPHPMFVPAADATKPPPLEPAPIVGRVAGGDPQPDKRSTWTP